MIKPITMLKYTSLFENQLTFNNFFVIRYYLHKYNIFECIIGRSFSLKKLKICL